MNRYRNLNVLARFQPRVVCDLMPGLAEVIGAATVFTYTRQMDEDEPFPGEWILKTDDERFSDYWIPSVTWRLSGNAPEPVDPLR